MLVSVVMAVHNGQTYLQEALDSILLQTYTDFELIVVDDASTDRTREILTQITAGRVKVLHLAENKGAAFALNLGIEQAQGKWIAIHDADDLSHPRRLEKQVNYLHKHPGLVAVGSFIECIRDRDSQIPPQNLSGLERLINRVQTSAEIKAELYRTCPLTHGTMLFSQKAFVASSKYDLNLRVSYDYDLWTRLITLGKIEKFPEKLYKYRMHSDSLTTKYPGQNISEMFFSCAKYIRHTCYQKKKARPAMVVFGPQTLADNYALQAKDSMNVIKIIDQNDLRDLSCLPGIINMFKRQQLDGAVILSNFRSRDRVFSYLTKNGLELHKNLFEFWIWF